MFKRWIKRIRIHVTDYFEIFQIAQFAFKQFLDNTDPLILGRGRGGAVRRLS